MKRWGRNLIGAAIAASFVTSAHAVTLIDDFQTFTDGQAIGGNNGWVTSGGTSPQFLAVESPAASGNMALAAIGSSRGVLKPAPALTPWIPDGQVETLNLRFLLQGTTNQVTFGMTHAGQSGFGQNALVGATAIISGTNLNVNDAGTTFTTNVSGLQTGVWYSLSMLIDNDQDVFSLVIDGGAFSHTQVMVGATDSFGFRSTPAGADLTQFGIRGNNNNASAATTALLFDDIFLGILQDDDDNGAAAVPEPMSAALIGLGGVVLLARRRRGD